jgi:hypothetical protein
MRGQGAGFPDADLAATQRGEWERIAPTGRKATWTVIIIGRFAGGKLAGSNMIATIVRQLGAV